MRSVGGAQDARGLGVHDHLSWPYEDRADFVRRAQEFVGEGLALGLRCVYAADRPLEQLEADLAGVVIRLVVGTPLNHGRSGSGSRGPALQRGARALAA